MRLSGWNNFLLLWLAPLCRPSFATSPASTSLPTCTPQKFVPLHIPIRNVTLSDGTLRRGAAVSIGTPGQPFAFQLAPRCNNTYLNDDTGCNVNDTGLSCSNEYGGLFDEGSSTTWSPTGLHALSAAGESSSEQNDDLWGSDTLLLNTTLSVPDFPLGIFRSNAFQNTLGLGRNSTLLNALSSAGVIFSRTFSIFQGWTGAQTPFQTDGSLILGGYDSAKIAGNNITLPLAVEDSCESGLVITVNNIHMNLMNGSNVSIIGESLGSAMRACIEPTFSPISLSEYIWWAFTNVTGVAEISRSGSAINTWGMILPAKGAYAGNLTFSIDPDLEITIPNHQLVVPEIKINSEGHEYPFNSSQVEVMINSLQNVNLYDMPLFGLPFLSSAYLIVDNDKQQFTLAQSRQSTISNLVAIGPAACNTLAPSLTSHPSGSVPASPSLVPTPEPSHSTPKGAIAGAVVGGLAVIAICMGLFFIQKRRRVEPLPRDQMQEHVTMAAVNSSVYTKSEMAADTQPPQEMPLDRDSGQGVAPYEMPGTPRFRA